MIHNIYTNIRWFGFSENQLKYGESHWTSFSPVTKKILDGRIKEELDEIRIFFPNKNDENYLGAGNDQYSLDMAYLYISYFEIKKMWKKKIPIEEESTSKCEKVFDPQ